MAGTPLAVPVREQVFKKRTILFRIKTGGAAATPPPPPPPPGTLICRPS